MLISVVGCGYLGAVHAACMAHLGHQVIGVDVDATKVDRLNRGEAPFFEPGFAEILCAQTEAGRLRFTTDFDQAREAHVHFIAVGTPQTHGRHAADMRFVDQAVTTIVDRTDPGAVIAGKSTVPVGSAQRISDQARSAGKDLHVVWNPEFLREGFAVHDTLRPNRIVYGLDDADPDPDYATAILDEVYASAIASGVPRLIMNQPTAELVKIAANSFLATKISFINAMAELCDVTGADVTQLAEAIGYDERIGKQFLKAGIGFGGGCLPKDIRAFMARAGELGVDQALTFLREVDAINQRQRTKAVQVAHQMLGEIRDAQVAVLGAAFKPDSDDLRDSPALNIAVQMATAGARIQIYDPAATQALRNAGLPVTVCESVDEACRGVDLVMLLTEWAEFIDMDPSSLAPIVHTPQILDGRNALDPERWRHAGWIYRGIGR